MNKINFKSPYEKNETDYPINTSLKFFNILNNILDNIIYRYNSLYKEDRVINITKESIPIIFS